MADEIDKASLKWIAEQEKLIEEGGEIVNKASNEALEYVKDAIENLNDRQWRKMAMSSQAVEIGVGIGLAEHLVPAIYKDMQKKLHRKLKVSKVTANALRHIYIGRVIKNLVKELERREQTR